MQIEETDKARLRLKEILSIPRLLGFIGPVMVALVCSGRALDLLPQSPFASLFWGIVSAVGVIICIRILPELPRFRRKMGNVSLAVYLVCTDFLILLLGVLALQAIGSAVLVFLAPFLASKDLQPVLYQLNFFLNVFRASCSALSNPFLFVVGFIGIMNHPESAERLFRWMEKYFAKISWIVSFRVRTIACVILLSLTLQYLWEANPSVFRTSDAEPVLRHHPIIDTTPFFYQHLATSYCILMPLLFFVLPPIVRAHIRRIHRSGEIGEQITN